MADLQAMRGAADRADMHRVAARLREEAAAGERPKKRKRHACGAGGGGGGGEGGSAACPGGGGGDDPAAAPSVPSTPAEALRPVPVTPQVSGPKTPPGQREPNTPLDGVQPMTPAGASQPMTPAGVRVPRTPTTVVPTTPVMGPPGPTTPREIVMARKTTVWYRAVNLDQGWLGLCSRYAMAAVASYVTQLKYERVIQPTSFLTKWEAITENVGVAAWPEDVVRQVGVFRVIPPRSAEVLNVCLSVKRLNSLGEARSWVRRMQGFPRVVVVAQMGSSHSSPELHAMFGTAAVDGRRRGEDALLCTNSCGVNRPVVSVTKRNYYGAWLVDVVNCQRWVASRGSLGNVLVPATVLQESAAWTLMTTDMWATRAQDSPFCYCGVTHQLFP